MNIVPFVFEGLSVRVVMDERGEPWFVAADLLDTLGLGRKALERIDEDEKGVSSIHTLGGEQQMTTVNESGMYALIMGSRKPAAKRFKKWVTSEVLPAIRKTGRYGQDPVAALNDPHVMRELLLSYAERMISLETKVEEQQPKVDALNRLAVASGSFCIRDAAKNLQMREKDLISFLLARRWVFRQPGCFGLRAYQECLQRGYMEHKVTRGERGDGTEWSNTQARITPKGLARLAVLLAATSQRTGTDG